MCLALASFLLAHATLSPNASPTLASKTLVGGTVYIHDDEGGVISEYMDTFFQIARLGYRIEVSGECSSACAFFLVSVIPNDRVCVRPGAKLGFHSAWYMDFGGVPQWGEHASKFMWRALPDEVKRIVVEQTGFDGQSFQLEMVYIDASQVYGACPTS